jgi:hypothetical protein
MYRSTLDRNNFASIQLSTQLEAPVIINLFRDMFYVVGRNTWFASIYARVYGGDELGSKLEEMMMKTIENAKKVITNKIAILEAAADGAGAQKLATYRRPESFTVDIASPFAMTLLQFFQESDKLVKMSHALWIQQVMPSEEKAKIDLLIKEKLNGIFGSTQSAFKKTLDAINHKKSGHGDRIANILKASEGAKGADGVRGKLSEEQASAITEIANEVAVEVEAGREQAAGADAEFAAHLDGMGKPSDAVVAEAGQKKPRAGKKAGAAATAAVPAAE